MSQAAVPDHRKWPGLYCAWAALAIGFSIAVAGLTAEHITRLLVLGFLFVQILLRSHLVKALPGFAPKTRFIILGCALAAVVEGFHMISTPVFASLRFNASTSFTQGLSYYAIDLLFTLPAYVLIFAVIWYFINRYQYSLWQYIIIMGLAQALGDGGLFYFLASPFMILFLPYPMTNYHAVNILPFLAVHDRLNPARIKSRWAWLALPGIIGIYLFCGSIIKIVGRSMGIDTP